MGKHGGGRDDGWEITAPAGLGDVFREPDSGDGELRDGAGDLDGTGYQDRERDSSAFVPPRRRFGGWGHRALVVVLIAAAGVIGFRVADALQQRDDGEILVPAERSVPAEGSGPAASPGKSTPEGTTPLSSAPSGETPPSASSAALQVHVIGAVKMPGLYGLNAGARVDDAVKAAGGTTSKADLSGLNLAQPVSDGIQVRVPAVGEAQVPNTGGGAQSPAAPGTTAAALTPDAEAVVNLNTADESALQTLPGIGPALSQRLIEWRERHGPFTSAADLDAVPGIGPAMLAKLEGKVGYG
ncbi:MAG: helix-hairpin-helix domain-containing protein [Galactobacter sp.]